MTFDVWNYALAGSWVTPLEGSLLALGMPTLLHRVASVYKLTIAFVL